MPKVYIHLSGRDIDSEILGLYGIADDDSEQGRKPENNYCPNCGSQLPQ